MLVFSSLLCRGFGLQAEGLLYLLCCCVGSCQQRLCFSFPSFVSFVPLFLSLPFLPVRARAALLLFPLVLSTPLALRAPPSLAPDKASVSLQGPREDEDKQEEEEDFTTSCSPLVRQRDTSSANFCSISASCTAVLISSIDIESCAANNRNSAPPSTANSCAE